MEYKNLKKENIEELVNCLQDSFVSEKINQEYCLWRYFDSFFCNKMVSYFAEEKNKIVSAYINTPLLISNFDKSFKAGCCAVIATRNEYQRQGLISKLSKLVYYDIEKNNYDFSIGFSNNSGIKVDKKSRDYNYQIIGEFHTYITAGLPFFKSDYKLEKVDNFQADILSKNKINYFNFNKSKEYLDWRYKKNPKKHYNIYKIVLKKEDIGYIVVKYSKLSYTLHELCISNKYLSDLNNIMKALEKEAFKNKKLFVAYNVLDNNFWKDIFNSRRYVKKNVQKDKFYLTVKIHNKNLKLRDELLDENKWFLTAGNII